MNMLKKTRADLSVALYFRTPCINLTDIAFALMLYDNYGHSERFFDVLDSHRRDFDSFEVVKEIVREHMNGREQSSARKPVQEIAPTPAQEVRAYVENEKVYTRLQEAGESPEAIREVRNLQRKFKGRFIK